MKNLVNKIKSFLVDEQGAETVEWVMIAAVLAFIISVAYAGTLGASITAAFTRIGLLIDGAGA